MPKPQSLDRSKGIAMMVYGIPGSEKTRLLGSGKTLIIRPPSEHTDSIDLPTNCSEVVVQDWSDMFELFREIQQGMHRDYDWFGLDSITLAQEILLEDVLGDAIARKPTRAIQKGGIMIPEHGADQGEYKVNMDRLSKWTRDMVALAKEGKFHFAMTAYPIEYWDPDIEKEVWAPDVRGKNMIKKICGYMNTVAYLKKSKEKGEVLLTVDKDGFIGKDQFNMFPKLKSGRHGLINPTLDDIEEAWAKTRKSSTTRKRSRSKTSARKTTRRRSSK